MDQPLQVLIVEDSENDALLLLDHLRRAGFDPSYKRVDTPASMSDALDTGVWDVVLADYAMPEFSGLDAFKLMRDRGLDLPFIIVSGAVGEDVAIEAMKAGVHDYLLKDSLVRLAPAIRREMAEVKMRHERRFAMQRTEHLNRVLRAIRSVNKLIVRGKDSRKLVEDTCKHLVKKRGYQGAWIVLTDESYLPKTIVEEGCDGVFLHLSKYLRQGKLPPCCWKALVRKETAVVSNPATDCCGCPLRETHCLEAPMAMTNVLKCEEKVFGFLCIYMIEGLATDQEERSWFQEISEDIAFALHSLDEEERQRNAETLREKLIADMQERIRELRCMCSVAESIRKRGVLKNNLRDIVKLIPSGWRYPEVTGARIRIDETECLSENFEESKWKQTASIVVGKQPRGAVEVCYLEERPVADDGPFRKEEQDLIDCIARMLSEAIEHNLAVQALRESEHRYRTLFEVVPMGICLTDRDGYIKTFNRAMLQLTGYTKSELEQMRTPDIFQPAQAHSKLLEQLPPNGQTRDFETTLMRKDGASFDAKLSVTLMSKGGAESLLAVIEEISEGKQMPSNQAQKKPTVRGRILVVDDEPYVGKAIKHMLREEHEVCLAKSGDEGRSILAKDSSFDLILCDLLMPMVSGMDLYEWLEGHHPKLAEKMVFMTGGAFTPRARQLLEQVPNPKLEKPFDPKALSSLVREWIVAGTPR